MNAVGPTSAVNACRDAAAAVATTPPAKMVQAANDAAPPPRRAAVASVTLPARIRVRRRREREVDVSISREAVTISSPDAAAASRPIASYRGVAVTIAGGPGEPLFRLSLAHEEPEHTVPLAAGSDVAAVAREWQAWAKALSLPLLAVDADGCVHAELTALGAILAERPSPRRRGSPLVGRRSPYGRRRRAAAPARRLSEAPVHRGEKEIIART